MAIFTTRYMKVPIELMDVRLKGIIGESQGMISWYKFNPFDLVAYRPTFTKEEPDLVYTTITLRNGDSTMVTLSPDDFERILNEFTKE